MHKNGSKMTLVFLPVYWEASWLLLPNSFYLLSAAHCNQKAPIPVFSRWQVRSEKAR